MLKGGCLCGAVRYEADGPAFDETICHCTDCRRAAAIASLDEPESTPPKDHSRAADWLEWDTICGGLREFPRFRP